MKDAIGLIVQLVGDFERSFEMRDCLDIGGTLQSEVSHLALPLYRNFAQAHFGEMVGDNLWFQLRSFRNLIPAAPPHACDGAFVAWSWEGWRKQRRAPRHV